MAEYYNVTTNLGDAEIANAIATNTKLNITHIAFGDGNGSVPTPSKSRTSLVREVHRQTVTKYERHPINANWIIIETIIPSSVGGFWVREMGIIANGKLISHGSHAPFEKVADPSGVSEYRLRFTQNVTDGSVVEITLDESLIYASQAWVEENFIKRSEIVDNLTTNDATKPVSAKQAKILQDNKLGKTENAATATKLATARTIAISGAVTGTATSFDGSANVAITTTSLDATKLSGTVPAARLPAASTSAAGAVKLNDTLISTSTTEALTAAQGKVLNDRFTNDFLNTKTETGYQKYPNGRIEQWGIVTASGDKTVIFPIAFTSIVTHASITFYAGTPSNTTMNPMIYKNNLTLTGMKIFAGTVPPEHTMMWKVEGY